MTPADAPPTTRTSGALDTPAQTAVRVLPREHGERLSLGLSEAARRLRFSTKGQASLPVHYRNRRKRLIDRIVRVGGLVALVIVPTLAAGMYFAFIASGQYVAEARFAVRSGAFAGLDSLASLTGIPSVQIVQDTQVVTTYIRSRAMVEYLDKEVALRAKYSDTDVDRLSRFDPEEPIEKLIKYWNAMNSVSIEMPGGIVHLTVRAFRPNDAVDIAKAAVAASERLVNEMNERAQRDALANAEHGLQGAANRLGQARVGFEEARNREGILDVTGEARKVNGLLAELRGQLLEQQAQYDVVSRSIQADSPTIRALKARIESLGRQVAQLQAELTTVSNTGADSLATSMKRFGAIELDQQIAERQYVVATVALDRAREAASTKHIYLTSFIQPVAPEEAQYPRRLWNTLLTLGAGLLAWSTALAIRIVLGRLN